MSESQGAVQQLSWLCGKWKSIEAKAFYPSMETVHYVEEMEFLPSGQSLLIHNSRTWKADTNSPMHCEMGYMKINPESDDVALIVSHNFGATEISEGKIGDKELLLKSKTTGNISFIKVPGLLEIRRHWKLEGDTLVSEVSMATAANLFQEHILAKYKKVNA